MLHEGKGLSLSPDTEWRPALRCLILTCKTDYSKGFTSSQGIAYSPDVEFKTIAFGLVLFALAFSANALEEIEKTNEPSLLGRYTANAQDAVMRALSFIGIRYRFGGSAPETGFDCSGFVRHVVADTLGLSLPRRSADISRVGQPVSKQELKPGDLVFFNTLRRAFSHVGIYLGENRFVHATSTGGSVRIDDMRERYWTARFNGARRVSGAD